jgi:uncharacterized paraquat-inducible protein A
MGWFGKSTTITTGPQLDQEFEVRCSCHACNQSYKPKPGDSRTTCPRCERNGHRGEAHNCRACANIRDYRDRA